jgi:proline iminopeptidase
MTADNHTINELYLDVSHNHTIYVHDWGNKKASTVIIHLHGGPGNGTGDKAKLKFDPEKHHVIFFDQRGSGLSTPLGKTDHNNTDALVEDIELIIEKLNLKNIILVGGSWGSTLALVYAISHPDQIKGLILDGIFLAINEEGDWLNDGGWRTFFPDVWQNYLKSVPKEHQQDPSAYLLKQSASKDPEVRKKAVYAYMDMEGALLKLDEQYSSSSLEDFDETSGLIEMHYQRHDFFLKPGYILKNADKIKAPVIIIQGRFDMVCPPIDAYKLNQALLKSNLIWTINGHIKQHEAHTIFDMALQQMQV